MIVHATADDLAAEPWSVTADNAGVLLRVASRLVDAALFTAVYDVDDTGRATEPEVLAALADATCAQAATWAALGIDPLKGAADEPGADRVVRKSIGSATVEYERALSADRAAAQAARSQAATTLCAEATMILSAAGLRGGQVWLHG